MASYGAAVRRSGAELRRRKLKDVIMLQSSAITKRGFCGGKRGTWTISLLLCLLIAVSAADAWSGATAKDGRFSPVDNGETNEGQVCLYLDPLWVPSPTATPTLSTTATPTVTASPDLGGNDPNTVFLLQSEHPDGSTDFADTSLGHTEPHPITVNGDVHHETSQARFGASAIEFTGYFTEGDSLQIPNSEDFDFGTNPFTIDLWIYPYQTNYAFGFAGNEQWVGPGWGVGIPYSTLVLHVNGFYVQTPAVIQPNTWQHVAFVREGIGTGQTKIYRNGQLIGRGATPDTGVSTLPLYIGSWGQGGPYAYFFDGLMEELRIVKGVACWTGPFTPPGGPYEGGPTPTPVFSPTESPAPTVTPAPTGTPLPTATVISCVHDGDANQDGALTPGDAQTAFFLYLNCASMAPT